MQVRIRGARGSVATAVAANLGFGGNTACVEVSVPGGATLVFDCGTGVVGFGREWMQRLHGGEAVKPLHVFFTHFHWDHLQGLPLFAPLFAPEQHLTFYSARPEGELRRILHGQMAAPYFPVEFETALSQRKFVAMDEDGVQVDEHLLVEAFGLHHPGGASGYRVQRHGAVVVYATDHEHGNHAADERLFRAAAGADVLIYDAQYTPEEYQSRVGWGHSTWLEATRMAERAHVKQLVLFHHDPTHDDEAMRHIVAQARRHFPNTVAACEGDVIEVG